ncbi:MAG: muconolactone delta-isomerase [Neomegalonema sp.]|nr:muconolactone delta-isomerase [Neomegalonema sp.]
MLYMVRIDVHLPTDMPADEVADLREREFAYERELIKAGEWKHIWRVVGERANFSVLDVASNERLHEILAGLPMYKYLDILVTPLAPHPSMQDGAI